MNGVPITVLLFVCVSYVCSTNGFIQGTNLAHHWRRHERDLFAQATNKNQQNIRDRQFRLRRTVKKYDAQSVAEFLERYNRKIKQIYTEYYHYLWISVINITDYNTALQVNNSLKASEFSKKYARELDTFDIDQVQNATQRRLLRTMSGSFGVDLVQNKTKLRRTIYSVYFLHDNPAARLSCVQFMDLKNEMKQLYTNALYCTSEDESEPCMSGLQYRMANTRNYTELVQIWTKWRNITGRRLKTSYQEFVEVANDLITEVGMTDFGESWRAPYESSRFDEEIQALLDQLLPLYQQLHAYVRKKLKAFYGADKFPSTGHIPAHLLGDALALDWSKIYDLSEPYPDKESLDVTPEMTRQNWTVQQMFRKAEEFFTSMGLEPMPQRFWDYSMLTYPEDGRKVSCYPRAYDFHNGTDFRIAMCAGVGMYSLITIHHEMGHIQYYLLYKDQPVLFQGGANPAFHEAVGDTVAMSMSTPEHLYRLGLLSTLEQDNEIDINFLMKMALQKIALLPFGYLLDKLRWSIFAGDTLPEQYNAKWWELRCKYQGLSPPVQRTSEDFDPGCFQHVISNIPYIRYFLSYVLQFTFYQRLCEAAGHTGPLHRCDFYQSQEAGNVFKEMLQKGSSEPWRDILEAFNGQRSVTATAILEYFQTLMDWLVKQNADEDVGWNEQCPPGYVQ